MTDRCIAKGAHSRQTKLPPIPAVQDTEKNLMLKRHARYSLPRLLHIEEHPEANVSFASQGRRGTRKLSSPCLNRNEFINLSSYGRRETVSYPEEELPRNAWTEGNSSTPKDYSPMQDITKGEPILQNAFRRPVKLLRRRIKPETVYRRGKGQIPHEELVMFDQNMDHSLPYLRKERTEEINDFNGRNLDPKRSGIAERTSYMTVFELENRATVGVHGSSWRATKNVPGNQLPSKKETKTHVDARFFEDLDLHFYHYYRNTYPGRRMAICEELEGNISVGKMTLSSVRDNLHFQELLDGWML